LGAAITDDRRSSFPSVSLLAIETLAVAAKAAAWPAVPVPVTVRPPDAPVLSSVMPLPAEPLAAPAEIDWKVSPLAPIVVLATSAAPDPLPKMVLPVPGSARHAAVDYEATLTTTAGVQLEVADAFAAVPAAPVAQERVLHCGGAMAALAVEAPML
jgi:hypothetical protein